MSWFNDEMVSGCADLSLLDLQRLNETLKQRLAWSDTKLLRSILFFWTLVVGMGTDSDEKGSDDKAQLRDAIEYIVTNL